MRAISRYLKYLPWGVYTLLACAVLGPLLERGYIFALDMVFTPHIRMPMNVTSSYVLRALLHYLNFVLPSDVIEKILLVVILLLAGVGMHQLLLHLNNKKLHAPETIAAYFAGLLYMVNPFTYERLMAGQYNVVFGYALLPFFARSLLTFLKQPGIRQTVYLALWAIAISIMSIHTIGFMSIFVLFAGGVKIWHIRNDKNNLKQLLKFSAISLAIFLVLSSYWLIPLAMGKGSTAENISSFSTSDQLAFATAGDGWTGKLGNVFHLQGFWLEPQDVFNPPQQNMPMWGVLIALIWVLAIIGIAKLLRENRRDTVIIFGGSMVLAAIFAIGTLNGWLADNVPFFAGYREPQKFVALIALGLVVFAAFGVSVVLKYCLDQAGKYFMIFASIILLLIPLIWTHTMLWGFDDQLYATNYPPAWFTVNEKLKADKSSFNTLFLPWHLYMGFLFAGHIIANPAPQFFGKPVIVSDNPEFRSIALSNSSPDKQQLDKLLPRHNGTDLSQKLAPLRIKYIILDKDDDYLKYVYLYRQKDLKKIYDSDTIVLFQNLDYKGV